MSTRLVAGDTAPDFSLPAADGTTVTLSAAHGRKVILFCYPAALTPGCTKEACDFRDAYKTLLDAGYVVFGLSPDGIAKLQKFAHEHELPFPLLSDPDKQALSAFGAWGEKSMYGKTVIGVIRSTFVIDEQGEVTSAMYAHKATGHVARLTKALGL